jgi:hypothetical protein
MTPKEFAATLAVGMNAAAHVALNAGHRGAYHAINEYRKQWEAKLNPPPAIEPRKMTRADIMPPDAARYATAADFGLDA